MLLIDTWGSLGDAAREEALYTRRSMGTKCPIVIAAAAVSSSSSGGTGSPMGTAMISPFAAISICA